MRSGGYSRPFVGLDVCGDSYLVAVRMGWGAG